MNESQRQPRGVSCCAVGARHLSSDAASVRLTSVGRHTDVAFVPFGIRAERGCQA